MNLIDWMLNLALVILWLDWRSGRAARRQHSILSLASALRPAEARVGQGWGSLLALVTVLLARPLFYGTVGAALDWVPRIDLLAISLPWRSDLLERMYIYSTIRFGLALGTLYSWLLLASAIQRGANSTEPIERFVRLQLGWLDKLPWWLKLLLPALIAGLCWMAAAPLFQEMELMPRTADWRRLGGQALALGLAALLSWKWFFVIFFLVHWLNAYVYLGTHPAWGYIAATSMKLLKPLAFLRVGRIDLAPPAGAVLAVVLAEVAIRPALANLFQYYS